MDVSHAPVALAPALVINKTVIVSVRITSSEIDATSARLNSTGQTMTALPAVAQNLQTHDIVTI